MKIISVKSSISRKNEEFGFSISASDPQEIEVLKKFLENLESKGKFSRDGEVRERKDGELTGVLKELECNSLNSHPIYDSKFKEYYTKEGYVIILKSRILMT